LPGRWRPRPGRAAARGQRGDRAIGGRATLDNGDRRACGSHRALARGGRPVPPCGPGRVTHRPPQPASSPPSRFSTRVGCNSPAR
jgi:hypothetical protein